MESVRKSTALACMTCQTHPPFPKKNSKNFTEFFEIDCSILIFVKHIELVPQFWKRKSCSCDISSFFSRLFAKQLIMCRKLQNIQTEIQIYSPAICSLVKGGLSAWKQLKGFHIYLFQDYFNSYTRFTVTNMIIILLQLINFVFCSCNCCRPRKKYNKGGVIFSVCQSTGGWGVPAHMPWSLVPGPFPRGGEGQRGWERQRGQEGEGGRGGVPHQDQDRVPLPYPTPPCTSPGQDQDSVPPLVTHLPLLYPSARTGTGYPTLPPIHPPHPHPPASQGQDRVPHPSPAKPLSLARIRTGHSLPPPPPCITPSPPPVGNTTDGIQRGWYASWVFTQEDFFLFPVFFQYLPLWRVSQSYLT